MESKKITVFGVDANIVLILMYVLAIILYLLPGACYFAWGIPMLVYIFESKNEYVKKQSVQAVMWFLMAAIFSLFIYLLEIAFNPDDVIQYYEATIASFKSFLLGIVSVIEMIGNIVIWFFSLITMIRIYSYCDYYIPFVNRGLKPFRKIVDIVVGEAKYEDDALEIEVDKDIVSVEELKDNINYVPRRGSKNKDKIVEKEDKDNE